MDGEKKQQLEKGMKLLDPFLIKKYPFPFSIRHNNNNKDIKNDCSYKMTETGRLKYSTLNSRADKHLS